MVIRFAEPSSGRIHADSYANLWMPYVEDPRIGGAHDFDVAPDVLSIEGDILAAPSDDVLVEAADPEEVRS